MDEELNENQGNDLAILKSHHETFAPHYPNRARELVRKHAEMNGAATTANDETTIDSSRAAYANRNGASAAEAPPDGGDHFFGNGPQPEATIAAEHVWIQTENNIAELKECGMSFYEQMWPSFAKEICREDSSKFDAVVTEPPRVPKRSCIPWFSKVRTDGPETENEEVEIIEFFCKKVVKRGGYAVVLAHSYMIDEWILVSNKFEFIHMPYLKTFLYKADTVA